MKSDILKQIYFTQRTTFLNNLQYKDETWNQIKYIGDYMWNDLFKWKCLKKQIQTFYR